MSYNRNNYPWSRPGGNSMSLSDKAPPPPSIAYSTSRKRPYSPDHFSTSHTSASSLSDKKHFYGRVTKLTDSWGVVEKDIYFSFSVCSKGVPKFNDHVSVDAYQTTSGSYKWKALKVIVAQSNGREHLNFKPQSSFSDQRKAFVNKNRETEYDRKRFKRDDRSDHDKTIHYGVEKFKNLEKSPIARSRSPVKRKIPIKYGVKVPNEPFISPSADIMTLKRRYPALYIPSDFCSTAIKWIDSIPLTDPYPLDKPCTFHIMNKDCDSPIVNDADYSPSDVDYTFSVKVMMMGVPDFDEIYKRTTPFAEDLHKEDNKYTHLSRLLQFLVGSRGKDGEYFPIGGPWSPSLDGENPRTDPATLIRTAVRTCRAFTGVDLSLCSRWYRFMEVYYHRSENVHKGKTVPARLETVVFFLPEMWTCMPNCIDWDFTIKSQYKVLIDEKLNPKPVPVQVHCEASEDSDKEEDLVVIDKCDGDKVEPTHFSLLDPQNMKVAELRQELEGRNLPTRGLKAHLVQRLELALRKEKDAEAESTDANFLDKFIQQRSELADIGDGLKVVDEISESSEKPDGSGEKPEIKDGVANESKVDVAVLDRATLERKYALPSTPHIIVHASKTAKAGKFECHLASIANLLDYKSYENKEHSFELYLFAELFHEMLQRDFGYFIYKSLCQLPEKSKEEKVDAECKKNDTEKKAEPTENMDTTDSDAKEKDETETATADEKPVVEESKKKENIVVKLVTKERLLLHSFLFFDRTRCGYIYERDLEILILSLGLQLSRNQIKKLIQKAAPIKDILHYRNITDKDENEEDKKVDIDDIEDVVGNRRYWPVFEDGSSSSCNATNSKLVNIGGAVVDVEKITASLKKSETTRFEIEKQLFKSKDEIDSLKCTIKKLADNEKKWYDETKIYREKLNDCYKDKSALKDQSRMFYKALMSVKETITQIEEKEKEREQKKIRREKEKLKEKESEIEKENASKEENHAKVEDTDEKVKLVSGENNENYPDDELEVEKVNDQLVEKSHDLTNDEAFDDTKIHQHEKPKCEEKLVLTETVENQNKTLSNEKSQFNNSGGGDFSTAVQQKSNPVQETGGGDEKSDHN